MLRYFIIYKPFQVLSQFSSGAGKLTLKNFFDVPPDVYPVGRLDYDSEGLLILTNDKYVNNRLLDPQFEHEREYWLQVEGIMNSEGLKQLEGGVDINIKGKIYRTKKCKVVQFAHTPVVPERNPSIRFRKSIPVSWVRLIIKEGKNRQVRKMTAFTGHPTLRLIRYRIEQITLDRLQPGEMRELMRDELYDLLFSKNK